MTLPGKFLGGFSGIVVADFGYAEFFLVAGAMGVPAILLSMYMLKNGERLDERAPVKVASETGS